MNINTLEPTQVMKIGVPETNVRAGGRKRAHSRSVVPILENSIISSQDFKITKR